MRKYLFLIGLLVVLTVRAEYFKQINIQHGLSQPSVMAIAQDGLGRMWFGTQEGVNVYDGNRLTAYKGDFPDRDGKNKWVGNFVEFIRTDAQGNVYLLCDGNLFFYDIYTADMEQITEGNKTTALESDGTQMWFAKGRDIYSLKTSTDTAQLRMTVPRGRINVIHCGHSCIYVGTTDGVFMTDKVHPGTWEHLLGGKDIYRLYESTATGLWIATRMEGLYRYVNSRLKRVPVTGNDKGTVDRQIREFVEDDAGNMWFGTFSGLQKYNPHQDKYQVVNIPVYAGGLNHSSIYSLYKDRSGTIWVGSYYGGVNYFNPDRSTSFHYDYQTSGHKDLFYSYIGDMVQDRDGRLWISTDGGGLSAVDRDWELVDYYTADDRNTIPHNNIKSLCYDSGRNLLYIGTHLGGLCRLDLTNKVFYRYDDRNRRNPGNIIYRIRKWQDRIFVSARNGMFVLKPDSDRFSPLPTGGRIFVIYDIDDAGTFYGISGNRLFIGPCSELQHPETVDLKKYGLRSEVTALLPVSDGVYLCTKGDGLLFYHRKQKTMTSYHTGNSGISSNYCYRIAFVHPNQAVITSDQGIMLFDSEKKTFSRLEQKNSSFPIIDGCGLYVSPEGEIYVGDTKGVTLIKETDFSDDRKTNSSLYFSSLWVNNVSIRPYDGSDILTTSLPFTQRISLEYGQNNLQLEFASSDYACLPVLQEYEYKLDGIDRDWIRTSVPIVRYTYLKPGKYMMRVRYAGEEKASALLEIVIRRPWYFSWWAWSIYVVMAGLILFFTIRIWNVRRKLKMTLEKERFEKHHIEELNRSKLTFFTNVSHELRTPLTLIASHIDLLLQQTKMEATVYNVVLKVKQHVQYMSNLVNELLDFRKFSQNEGTLVLRQKDLCAFIKEIFLTFQDYALRRNMDYRFDAEPESVPCWFDERQLEKVFFNLLSNAFKSTDNGGQITVSVRLNGEFAEVAVTDNGCGIAESDLPHIFDRFYQSRGSEMKGMMQGTGIGLALTKSIVEKHHGRICVESRVGIGSTFRVLLSLERSEYEQDEHITIDETEEKQPVSDFLPETEEDQEGQQGGHKYKLLVVEDNLELQQILLQLFRPYYQVAVADNGRMGLEQVYAFKPDIIVSDIMMPVMTGTELCMKIKNNMETCHLPVILLTALNSVEQNIEGLNRGADDYVCKPFDHQLLLARVNNLLRNRTLIHQQLSNQPVESLDLTSVNPLDQKFLHRVSEIIQKHMGDSAFDIAAFCQEIGMGRSVLYSKFKALTGMTPSNFILNARLQHAAMLLQKHPELSVTEVSERCGFNAPVYFSKCFKAQFQMTPVDYRKAKIKV